MSESVRHISIEFGKFRFVLDGFETPSEGVETAIDLIRKLADLDIDDTILATLASHLPDPDGIGISQSAANDTQVETSSVFAKDHLDDTSNLTDEAEHHGEDKDLVSTEETEPAKNVEFHSKRLLAKTDDPTTEKASSTSNGDWQQELARLEHSINNAILALKPARSTEDSTQTSFPDATELTEQPVKNLENAMATDDDVAPEPEVENGPSEDAPAPEAAELLQPHEEMAEDPSETGSLATEDFPQTSVAANSGQTPDDPASEPEDKVEADAEMRSGETASDTTQDEISEQDDEEPALKSKLVKDVVENHAQPRDSTDSEQSQPEGEASKPVSEADIEILPNEPEQSAIARGIAVNKEAIVKSAISQIGEARRSAKIDEHYQPVEDQEIERLMDTTNTLLDDAEHTRKSRSLERLKAAVVATEAERSIKVRTSRGTVTLDFDAPAKSAHQSSPLIMPPEPSPEMRTERLEAYRKMIAARKFGS